jgi:predicted  nucleic acid-binding Zn-ribbon protein
MPPDLKLVIQLQDLDSRIRELQREIAALPKHISEIEKALESHVRKLEADRAALAANQRERKKLEADIQTQEQKTSHLKDQMMEAKTNEQYRAFQKEIDYCQKETRRAEDRILSLMEESEPLEQNVKAAQAALKEEKQKVDAEKQQARACTAEDKKALEELTSERQTIVDGMTPAVYSAYERIRIKRRGLAVAEAVDDGRCSACHLALRPQFFQDLRCSTEVMFCESCGRILYYNPPISFQDIAAAQPGASSQS